MAVSLMRAISAAAELFVVASRHSSPANAFFSKSASVLYRHKVTGTRKHISHSTA